jgi:hypothetical protein
MAALPGKTETYSGLCNLGFLHLSTSGSLPLSHHHHQITKLSHSINAIGPA